MKSPLIFIVLTILSFTSCQDKSGEILSANVYFLAPGPCCSNMELINMEPIYSEIAGYQETILGAVNIDDFQNLDLKDRDSLSIQYRFSELNFQCIPLIDCNRASGVPIELVSARKL